MAKVGTSKIRVGRTGSHNKPAGCGASEAYDSGPEGEEEEEVLISIIKYLREN